MFRADPACLRSSADKSSRPVLDKSPPNAGRVVNRKPEFEMTPLETKPPSISPETTKASESVPRAEIVAEFVTSPVILEPKLTPTDLSPRTLICPPVVRLPVKPSVIKGVLARFTPKLSFPSTEITDVAASSTFPWKGEAPDINIPVRPDPWAKAPSAKGSSSVFSSTVDSRIEIEPVCV